MEENEDNAEQDEQKNAVSPSLPGRPTCGLPTRPIAIYPGAAGGRSVAGSEMTVVNSRELTVA